MSQPRFNKDERNYVKRTRRAFQAEQQVRAEVFESVQQTDRQFNRIVNSLYR